jgi:hypothetical protein
MYPNDRIRSIPRPFSFASRSHKRFAFLDIVFMQNKNCQKLYFNGSWLSYMMQPLMCILQDPLVLRHTLTSALLFSSLFPLLREYLFNTKMSRKKAQKNTNKTRLAKYSVISIFNKYTPKIEKNPNGAEALRFFSCIL